jgi:hypothetical protein
MLAWVERRFSFLLPLILVATLFSVPSSSNANQLQSCLEINLVSVKLSGKENTGIEVIGNVYQKCFTFAPKDKKTFQPTYFLNPHAIKCTGPSLVSRRVSTNSLLIGTLVCRGGSLPNLTSTTESWVTAWLPLEPAAVSNSISHPPIGVKTSVKPNPTATPSISPTPRQTSTPSQTLAPPVITSTFAKRDSIQVIFAAVAGVSYKLDLLNTSGTVVRNVCTLCKPSNTIFSLTPSTGYLIRLTATQLTQRAVTERFLTTYPMMMLEPSISSFTRTNNTYTATFNPKSNWSYRLQSITGDCRGSSPLSTTSPIVWNIPDAVTSCRFALYAEDIFGNSGATILPSPTLIDTALPSARLVSASQTSLTGAGTINIAVRAVDDLVVSDVLILLKNSAGATVATANKSEFLNGTETNKLFATSLNVPAGLPAGTYSLVAQTTDWMGKSSIISIGTITIR